MSLTTDPNDPELKVVTETGQNKKYLVLSEEERAKGFVKPVRQKYKHLKCGTITVMGLALSETYARDPKFYGATFCTQCGQHFPLQYWDQVKDVVLYNFLWEDGEGVGS